MNLNHQHSLSLPSFSSLLESVNEIYNEPRQQNKCGSYHSFENYESLVIEETHHSNCHFVNEQPLFPACKVATNSITINSRYRSNSQSSSSQDDSNNLNILSRMDNSSSISPARNFTCHKCNRSFARKGDLNSHMRTHTGMLQFHSNLSENSS